MIKTVEYYAYENWRARGHKAVVHVASCAHCNHGKGLTTGTKPQIYRGRKRENGKWHGPFETLTGAQAAVPGVTAQLHNCC
jgi:hypothetical protein